MNRRHDGHVSIAAALKENPLIGDHTIAVLLFNYESKDRVQQMFSDLNRFVVKTSKSLDILYDKRDKIAADIVTDPGQVDFSAPVLKAKQANADAAFVYLNEDESGRILRELRPDIGFGLGVIDVKTQAVETPDIVAERILGMPRG